MGDLHYNVYHSKSHVHKLSFLRSSIATNDGPILLTIEGKLLEAIVHMTKFEFINLGHSKQVQLLVSICVFSIFQLSSTFSFINFQENIQQFIP